MRPVLGKVGRQRLQALARTRSLYAFDFDGTLTRIRRDRHAVSLPAAIRGHLRALSRQAPTTIISGRSLQDLRGRVGGSVSYLIGNHGVEGPRETVGKRRARHACAAWKRQVSRRFAGTLRRVGVELEDKAYSLAFHYRTAPRRREARDKVLAVVSALKPSPRVVHGKSCVNLLPPGAPNKGEALVALMARLGLDQALFVGDDATDEDVFRLRHSRIMTVRIGRRRTSAAQFFLDRQSDISDLLRALLTTHRAPAKFPPAGQTATG